MSKYLLVLGAPDGASNASFQPIADAMAKGFGEQVPFVVWTDAQLSALPGPATGGPPVDLGTFLAPFNAKIMVPDEVFLYVIAGNDVLGPSLGNRAMDLALLTEGALDVIRGIIYTRTVTESEAAKLPGTSLTTLNPPPILAFQKVADANPTRLRMTQVSAILGWPTGKSLTVPVANQVLPGQFSVSTQHIAVNLGDVAAPSFMPNLAYQLAVALAGSSGGSGGGGPLIEPKPSAKPDAAAKKQASLFSSPVVLIGALGVGAYFLFFRKKRGHKGSSSRRS